MNYETLSNRALISILIGEDGAKALYKDSLEALFARNTRNSKQHAPLHAARELVRRVLSEELRCQPVLSSPGVVKDYLRIHFMGQEYESFAILFLNAQHRLVAAEDVFRGTVDQTSVYPREVMRQVIHWNASAVILAHNHPSGSPEPSPADRNITKAIRETLILIEVRVLDHIIVAGAQTFSFAERGLIT